MGEYSLNDALGNFINNSRLKKGLINVQLPEAWEKIMGKTVAKYTDKLQLVNQTLFVTTNMAPLKNELMFQRENIIQQLNDYFGEKLVNKIVVN